MQAQTERFRELTETYTVLKKITDGGYSGWEESLRHPDIKAPGDFDLAEIFREEALARGLLLPLGQTGRRFVFYLNLGTIQVEQNFSKVWELLELAASLRFLQGSGEGQAMLRCVTSRDDLESDRVGFNSPMGDDYDKSRWISLKDLLIEKGFDPDKAFPEASLEES